jgi:CheY-like chemotaxis protein
MTPRPKGGKALEKKKILVIEDEEDTASYLTTFFEDSGYDALAAKDGQEGLAMARKESPDLITLDISMPEKSGLKTLRELQEDEATSKIPVIIVTGVSEDLKSFIDKQKHISPPAGHINKPIDTEDLLKTIKSLLS